MLHTWYSKIAAAAIIIGSPGMAVAQASYRVLPARPQPPSATEATQPSGRHPRVTLELRDSTLAYVVRVVARRARQAVWFDDSAPIFAKRIAVHLSNASVQDAFTAILKGTGLTATMASDGETLVIRPTPTAGGRATTETGSVSGRVLDSVSGRGLNGATVRVQGLKLSVLTTDSGHFTLRDVPVGDQVLTVRLFGFRPATRAVTVTQNAQTTVRVVMTSMPTVLSGVVTTATGKQRKVEVGNDITTINVDSVMRVAPVSSVTDLLETRVPGLTVLHTSGTPGDPSRIRLRGVGSVIGNNDPIVVVDGVRVYASQSDSRNANLAPPRLAPAPGLQADYAAPSPLDQIDPSSIETIEVFKGPSASALYGSDAGNGVIVITTKRGRAGPTRWNLTLGDGLSYTPGKWPTNYYRFGLSLSDQTGFNALTGQCKWDDLSCLVDSVVPFQALNNSQMTLFSHGSNQTADLTVSGGVSVLTYSLTGSAGRNLGLLKLPGIEVQRFKQFYGAIPHWMIRPDNYTTSGVSGQLTAQPRSALRVTLSSSLYNSNQQRGSLNGAILQIAGTYIDPADLVNTPLIFNDVERVTDHQLTSTNALTLQWQPLSWLPIQATGGLNTIQRTDETYIPYGVNAGGPGSIFVDTTGSYGVGRGSSLDQTITVGTSLPMRVFTTAIGMNFHKGSTADVTAFTSQLAPGVSVPTQFPTTGCGIGGDCSTFGQSTVSSSTYGWYVEPRLNFASRFFVAPGFRLDGGSASGANGGFNGSGLTGFPKIDLSYVAVDESHPRGPLTMLRPRLAVGVAGTQPAPTAKLRLFTDATGGSTSVPIVQLQTLGNTQLQPEHATEVEGGFDVELWRRFSMTWTQYNKTRRNAIISIPVAPDVYGLGQSIFKNIGVVRNTGRELSVQATLLQSQALSWAVGMNLSNNNNLVVRLNPGQAPIDIGSNDGTVTRIVAGYPLFSRWALPIVSFADVNHNGVIEYEEIRVGDSLGFVGQQEPKYQLNANTNVTLLNGRLSVNAQFAYQNGMTQNNTDRNSYSSLPNRPGASLATQAAVTGAFGTCTGFGTGCVDRNTSIGLLQTANTFRFNALSINYTLPTQLASRFRVPRMLLALQGSNLYLHTNYRGKDPNVNVFSNVSAADETIDTGQLPQPRVWWLKLTLGN